MAADAARVKVRENEPMNKSEDRTKQVDDLAALGGLEKAFSGASVREACSMARRYSPHWTTTMRSIFIMAAAASLLAVGSASAQTSAPAPAMDKAALSKSCSSQADAKGLHGKARKHFRSACKHGH